MRVLHELSTTSWVTTCCCKKSQSAEPRSTLVLEKPCARPWLSSGGLGMVGGSRLSAAQLLSESEGLKGCHHGASLHAKKNKAK